MLFFCGYCFGSAKVFRAEVGAAAAAAQAKANGDPVRGPGEVHGQRPATAVYAYTSVWNRCADGALRPRCREGASAADEASMRRQPVFWLCASQLFVKHSLLQNLPCAPEPPQEPLQRLSFSGVAPQPAHAVDRTPDGGAGGRPLCEFIRTAPPGTAGRARLVGCATDVGCLFSNRCRQQQ